MTLQHFCVHRGKASENTLMFKAVICQLDQPLPPLSPLFAELRFLLLSITNSPGGFSASRNAWFMTACIEIQSPLRPFRGLVWWIKRTLLWSGAHNNNVDGFLTSSLSVFCSVHCCFALFSFFSHFHPQTFSLSPSLPLCGFPFPLNLIHLPLLCPLMSSLWDRPEHSKGGWLRYQADLSGLS